MANRTGTYIAFDALGETDPTKSDFRFYGTIQAWDKSKHIDFQFVNSHDKTYAVKDTSQLETLKQRIRDRLSASKQMVVIVTTDTRNTGSMLSYEIEQAIDKYKLPLICIYPGFETIFSPSDLSGRWPAALKQRIDNKTAAAIHIPFKKAALLDAVSQFTVNSDKKLVGGLNYYSREAHIAFGCEVS